MSAAVARLPEATSSPGPALRDVAVAASKTPRVASPNLDALWLALVEGRFRLVEAFEQGGWRYLVLSENRGDAALDKRLTPRERHLVEAVGRGESEKAVAFALGVTPSAASTLLKSAMAKLGLRSKMELVVVVGAMREGAASEPPHAQPVRQPPARPRAQPVPGLRTCTPPAA